MLNDTPADDKIMVQTSSIIMRPPASIADATSEHGDAMLVSSGKSVKYSELLNPSILNDLPALKERFRTAAPFPHMVFDGLFSPQLLELVADDFALVGEAQLKKRQSEPEVTYRSRTDVNLPASAQ